MNKINNLLTISCLILLTQGCTSSINAVDNTNTNEVINGPSTSNLPIGKAYSRTPPKLVRKEVSWGTNKPRQMVAWDNSQWFGPIPANKMQEGIKTCRAIGGQRARGYHPNALGVNGKPIPGGGFLCS